MGESNGAVWALAAHRVECPLLANNGLSGHVAGTSALPPIAEVRAPMSALVSISSASPPGADLPGGVAEGPFLTQPGHYGCPSNRTQDARQGGVSLSKRPHALIA